jgi:hypothetical protein
MIIRLKTATEEAMIGALKSAMLTGEDGELITATHDYFASLIGTLYKDTGVTLIDNDGSEYPEKAPIDGYHVNLVTADMAIINALIGITVTVDKPLIKIDGEK